MPLAPASKAWKLLLEYRNELFTIEILEQSEQEHERLVDEKIIDDLRATSERAVLDAIEGLCSRPIISNANEYLESLPITIQVFLFERFFYFESALRELGEREVELPSQFESFLRQGLIDAWNVRRQRGWFF